MLGALIGDIAGSRFEWHNKKEKEFELLSALKRCRPTDDSIMTLALARAILNCNDDYSRLGAQAVSCMQAFGRKYPHAGYGGKFHKWIYAQNPHPYNSYGNGAAMRVSPCGFAATSLEEAIAFADRVTEVTHNHPEGMKAAEAVSAAIYLARTGKSMLELRDYIERNYYRINFTLDAIRPTYSFDVSCQGSVPQAFEAFFESTGFEDAIRNAISIGGDSDTIAAITGGIAEAYYGIPTDLRKYALTFLDEFQLSVLNAFEGKFGFRVEKTVAEELSRPVSFTPAPKKQLDEAQSNMFAAMDAADQAQHSTDIVDRETTANQLYNHLFEACNILRGPIDQDDYKSYVIPILFFKRLSDVYDEETAENEQKYGEDIAFYPEDELHAFVIPEGCHWNDVRETSEDVGKAIVDAMMGIEHANPDTLAGLFSSFDDANWTDKTKLDDERLKDLIEHMSALPVGNRNYSADVMGDAYEYLIKKFADLSKKNAGEFYTPRSVVKLMVRLLQPRSGESVYDPTCGSGGILISCIDHIKSRGQEWRNVKVYGQEIIPPTASICRMNLFLHGVKEFTIRTGDTLSMPAFLEKNELKKFDLVVANPPYSISNWDRDAFSTDKYGRNILGTPPQGRADYAFIQHILKSMDPITGRCAILLPHGVLFRKEEAELRKRLVELDLVEAVIGIGKNLFYNSPMEACIMVCRAQKPADRRNKVLFINARNEVTRKNAESFLEDRHIEKIVNAYRMFADGKGFSKVVSQDDILSSGARLSIALYVRDAGDGPVGDPSDIAIITPAIKGFLTA